MIASKFPSGLRFRADDFPSELDASLNRLGRPNLDLYQHHFPGRVSIPDLMNHLADAVEAGKVTAVGVSNYSAEQMRQAHAALADRGVPLASNQVEYSLLHRQPETNGVLDACRELGVTLIAYTPLAGGMLTGKYSAENRPTGFYRRVLPRYRRKALDAIQPVVGAPPRDRRSTFEDAESGGPAVADREPDRAAHPWRQERQAGNETTQAALELLVGGRRSRRLERCNPSLEGLSPRWKPEM